MKALVMISGAVALVLAVMYGTAVVAASKDGPAGLEVSSRFGGIMLSAMVLCAVVCAVGWMILAANRANSAKIADATAAAVMAGIQQSLNSVADRSVNRSNDAIIEAMREIADELRGEMQTMVLRARTQGMVEEAAQRGTGNVASIAGRRDT